MRVTNAKVEHLIIISLFVLCILNLGDAFSTYVVIESGLGEELNPVMNALIGEGMELFLLLKLVISVTLLYVGLHINNNRNKNPKKKDFLYKHRKIVSLIVLLSFATIIICYCIVIVNNLLIALALK